MSLALNSAGTPFVAFASATTSKAGVMRYTGTGTTGWVAVGPAGFSPGGAAFTSLAIDTSSDTLYVSFKDSASSTATKASVMKYTAATNSWAYMGAAGISDGAVTDTRLAIYAGVPYVAFDDAAYGGKVTVMK